LWSLEEPLEQLPAVPEDIPEDIPELVDDTSDDDDTDDEEDEDDFYVSITMAEVMASDKWQAWYMAQQADMVHMRHSRVWEPCHSYQSPGPRAPTSDIKALLEEAFALFAHPAPTPPPPPDVAPPQAHRGCHHPDALADFARAEAIHIARRAARQAAQQQPMAGYFTSASEQEEEEEEEEDQPAPVAPDAPRQGHRRKQRKTIAQWLVTDELDWKEQYDKPCCRKLGCSLKYLPSQIRVIRSSCLAGNQDGRKTFIDNRLLQEYGGGVTKYPFLSHPDVVPEYGSVPICPATTPGSTERVCVPFFLWATAQSNNKLYQPGKPGENFTVQRKAYVSTRETKAAGVVRWLLDLGRYYQIDPTSDLVLLPFRDRQSVYEVYAEEMSTALQDGDFDWLDSFCPPGKICTPKYFKRVWRHDNPLVKRIKLRKWLKFAKCDTCVDLRQQSRDAKSTVEREKVRLLEQEHWAFVKLERQSYWDRRDLGRNQLHRAQHLSLIIDAADQAAYASPYFYERSHASQAAWRLPMHLIAAISHGRKTFGYSFLENIKHGNNLTIEVLHRVLLDTLQTEGRLPAHLLLQLDNTSKQFKGKYVLGYIGYLVERGVFEDAKVSFLPVGHTHEDIDQIFSRLAVYLRKHDCRNQEELLECLQEAFTPKHGHRVQVGHLTTVANISDWIKPYLTSMSAGAGGLEGNDGLMQFRQFRFTMVDGKTCMQCREKCGTDDGVDKFKGLHPYKDVHQVFKKEPPDLIHGDVPDAQRRDIPTEDHQTKLRKGNKVMVEARRIPPEVNQLLEDCIDLVCSRDPIPFHWSQDEIDMYSPVVEEIQAVDPVAAAYQAMARSWSYAVGSYVICNPESAGEDTKEEWFLAKIMGVKYQDPKDHMHWKVPVMWFEPTKKAAKADGRLTYKKAPRGYRPDPHLKRGWDSMYLESVQDDVLMSGGKGTHLYTVKGCQQVKVKYWVLKFKKKAAECKRKAAKRKLKAIERKRKRAAHENSSSEESSD
jgi:hypothetical protein